MYSLSCIYYPDFGVTDSPGNLGIQGCIVLIILYCIQVVGVTDSPGNLGIQLQRVVSRCKAEFFYVSYGDTALDDVEASVAGACKMSGNRS